MVWSQYVYEATTGYDVNDSGDDEESTDIIQLNIEDWEIEYSEELHMMWNTIRTLLHDAHIEHKGQFVDFVAFCFKEHDPYHENITTQYDQQLMHIWKNIRRIINNNHLHEVMIRGAGFFHFVDFVKNYMCIY